MMEFPLITEEMRLTRLNSLPGQVRMVLDTDTYNEVDDQFALVYSLLSPEKMSVKAVYAAPFHNERSAGPADGMEKSYQEILRLLEMLKNIATPPAIKGSTHYLNADLVPERSPAALDLVERAMDSPESDPLYVVAIGAITNVASAILIEPRIIERIIVVWLGGHAFFWPDTKEFNLKQDVPSSRLIFDCGVPLVHIPCMGVTTHLLTTIPELETHVGGRGQIGDYLINIVKEHHEEHFGWSKVIWDIATIGYLINQGWVSTALVHSPILTDRVTWSFDQRRHLIRSANFIHRDPIFYDLFKKLNAHYLPQSA